MSCLDSEARTAADSLGLVPSGQGQSVRRATAKVALSALIARGESASVEFHGHLVDSTTFAKSIVAFANLQGGRILIGVDGGARVVGIRGDGATGKPVGVGRVRGQHELEEWVAATCREKIEPMLLPRFDTIRDILPGHDVAILTIDRGWTVHHVRHKGQRLYYVRAGRTHREATLEELAARLPRRGAYRMELRPVSGTSLADLDHRRLVDYFSRVREQKVPGDGASDGKIDGREADWQTLLVNTLMVREEAPHSVRVAALVLFGKDSTRFLPHAKVEAVAYHNVRKSSGVKDRRTLHGAIVPLQGTDGSLVERGLVEQAMDFVVQNAAAGLRANDARSGRHDLPVAAVREAVLNAIVHRDYEVTAGIEINIYADRLEVVSPGRLANDNAVERMKAGCRRVRNELVRDVMRDYGYMDHIGLGVPCRIVRAMREHNGTEPDLVPEEDRFTVRLWRQPARRAA